LRSKRRRGTSSEGNAYIQKNADPTGMADFSRIFRGRLHSGSKRGALIQFLLKSSPKMWKKSAKSDASGQMWG
jgi:hypothetical protein